MEQEKAATPHAILMADLLNPNVPKNEREWAAAREIKSLRERIATGPYVRSTRNGVVRTPVGWVKANTEYALVEIPMTANSGGNPRERSAAK